MHMLITINDLKPLTDAELDRLEVQLRHILDTHALTNDDRITIIASLVNIRIEIDHRAASQTYQITPKHLEPDLTRCKSVNPLDLR